MRLTCVFNHVLRKKKLFCEYKEEIDGGCTKKKLPWLLSVSSRLYQLSNFPNRAHLFIHYNISAHSFSMFVAHGMHKKTLSPYITPHCPLPAFLPPWKLLRSDTRLGFDHRLRLACVRTLMHRRKWEMNFGFAEPAHTKTSKDDRSEPFSLPSTWHKWTAAGQDARPRACKLLPFSVQSLQSYTALKWKREYADFHKMWRHLNFKST